MLAIFFWIGFSSTTIVLVLGLCPPSHRGATSATPHA